MYAKLLHEVVIVAEYVARVRRSWTHNLLNFGSSHEGSRWKRLEEGKMKCELSTK